jgi:hypothetical protein
MTQFDEESDEEDDDEEPDHGPDAGAEESAPERPAAPELGQPWTPLRKRSIRRHRHRRITRHSH